MVFRELPKALGTMKITRPRLPQINAILLDNFWRELVPGSEPLRSPLGDLVKLCVWDQTLLPFEQGIERSSLRDSVTDGTANGQRGDFPSRLGWLMFAAPALAASPPPDRDG